MILWDVDSGALRHTLVGLDSDTTSVTFSPDSKTVVAGGTSSRIVLWDVTSGANVRGITASGIVYALAYSPDGRILASGSFSPTSVVLYDVATGAELGKLDGHIATVYAVAFSPDGKFLVSGSGDSTLVLWDVPGRRALRTLKGHEGDVYAVAFSPDGKAIASGGKDGKLRFWEPSADAPALPAARAPEQICPGPGDTRGLVAFDRDAGGYALLLNEGIAIVDSATGAQRLLPRSARYYSSLTLSPDGRLLAAVDEDNNAIALWDVAGGTARPLLTGPGGSILILAFSPDGSQIASGDFNGSLKLWDIATGKLIRAIDRRDRNAIYASAFSPDGKTVAGGYLRYEIVLWDVASGGQRQLLTGHRSTPIALAFSTDGRTLASGSGDKQTIFWDVAAGTARQTSLGHTDAIVAVRFAPDGATVASADKFGTIVQWDAASGAAQQTFRRETEDVPVGLAVSADGAALLVGYASLTVARWSLTAGR